MTTVLDTIVPLHAADLPDEARRMELIDGSLHVPPGPSVRHQVVVGRMTTLLQAVAPAGVLVLPGANLLRARSEGDTLLVPDVLAFRPNGDEDALSLDPSIVLLVVEVVSPSSRRMDAVTKRGIYEEWGIPAYVVVDAAQRITQTLVLSGGVYVPSAEAASANGPLAPGWPVRTSDIW